MKVKEPAPNGAASIKLAASASTEYKTFFNPWIGLCTYHAVPNRLYTMRPLMSDGALRLYDTLVDMACFVERTNEFTFSQAELSKRSGVSVRCLPDAIDELENRCRLIATRPSGKNNKVTITLCNPETGKPVPSPEEQTQIIEDNGTGIRVAPMAELVQPEYESRDQSAGFDDEPGPEPLPRDDYKQRTIFMLTEAELERYYRLTTGSKEYERNAKGFVMLPCDAHGDGADENPSLSVDPRTGWFHCFACKGEGNVFDGNVVNFEMRRSNSDFVTARQEIVRLLGLKDVYCGTRTPKLIPIAQYRYRHEDGTLQFIVERYANKPKFSTYSFIDGHKVYVAPPPRNRVLYRLDELKNASVIVVVEGEKDADTITHLGLVSADGKRVIGTTNAYGAEGDWLDDYSLYLRDKKVILCGDRDTAGVTHMNRVFESLKHFMPVENVKRIELDEYPIAKKKGKDVTDFIEDGHTTAELVTKIGDWVRLA